MWSMGKNEKKLQKTEWIWLEFNAHTHIISADIFLVSSNFLSAYKCTTTERFPFEWNEINQLQCTCLLSIICSEWMREKMNRTTNEFIIRWSSKMATKPAIHWNKPFLIAWKSDFRAQNKIVIDLHKLSRWNHSQFERIARSFISNSIRCKCKWIWCADCCI